MQNRANQTTLIDPHIIFVSILTGAAKDCQVQAFLKEMGNGQLSSNPAFPTIFRFIKKAICDPIVSYLEVNNHLCGWQYGFRNLIPSKLALIDLFNAFVDAMEAIETVIGKFADLSKALNCVDAITIPFQKLTALGIKISKY